MPVARVLDKAEFAPGGLCDASGIVKAVGLQHSTFEHAEGSHAGQAMHFRNPRRSIPSWLWSNKIASWFFCSGIFSFPLFPNKVRSRFTV